MEDEMRKTATILVVIILLETGCRKQVSPSQFHLDSKDVVSATMTEGDSGNYKIDVMLSEAASQRFAKLTEENMGKKLPLVVDGEVVSEPLVSDVITGPRLIITGRGKQDAERILEALTK
jgi:preprotein translocase subunit SecD